MAEEKPGAEVLGRVLDVGGDVLDFIGELAPPPFGFIAKAVGRVLDMVEEGQDPAKIIAEAVQVEAQLAREQEKAAEQQRALSELNEKRIARRGRWAKIVADAERKIAEGAD